MPITTNIRELIKSNTGNDFAYTQTADATPTTIYTLTTEDYSIGFVEYIVFGNQTDGTAWYSGSRRFRYVNDATVISTGTETTIESDTGITGATIGITGSYPDINIQVTGVAATDIDWKVIVQHWSHTYEPAV